jgi:hypothetical protein
MAPTVPTAYHVLTGCDGCAAARYLASLVLGPAGIRQAAVWYIRSAARALGHVIHEQAASSAWLHQHIHADVPVTNPAAPLCPCSPCASRSGG